MLTVFPIDSLSISTVDDSTAVTINTKNTEPKKVKISSTEITCQPSSSSSSSGDTEKDVPKLAHESVFQKFEKPRKGKKIHAKNLNSIFSILMINLKLTAELDHNPKPGFRLFSAKAYPYSFSVDNAISHMKFLKLSVNHPATNTTFSYSIKHDLAFALIKKFMRATLLHTPEDRTRLEPKIGVLLQPTPKGCAILQSFCHKIGLKGDDLPPILFSSFNTMDLISLERHPLTDNIVYSEYLIHLIFTKFIGPKPNVWGSSNGPDPISKMVTKLNQKAVFNFSQDPDGGELEFSTDWDAIQSTQSMNDSTNKQEDVSPFYHKFFTNPESDAHVQYYSSEKGVRLFASKTFGSGDNNTVIKYYFTGKAAIQWFMDCTDTVNHSEAAELVNLFLKYNLVVPITDQQSISQKATFSSGHRNFYTLTDKGLQLSQWGLAKRKKMDTIYDVNTVHLIASKELKLDDILEDPGSRFLFRSHLEDNLCAENLDVYTEINYFIKQMVVLKKLLTAFHNHLGQKTRMDNSSKNKQREEIIKQNSKQAVHELVNDCLSKAYSIYSSYLSYGAPYEVNISDDWRRQAQGILVHPMSPFRESFATTPTSPFMPRPNFDTEVDPKDPAKRITRSPNGVGKFPSLLFPTLEDESIEQALTSLERILPLFQKINKHIFFLLSQDSFPKFINSEVFQESNNQMRLRISRSQ